MERGCGQDQRCQRPCPTIYEATTYPIEQGYGQRTDKYGEQTHSYGTRTQEGDPEVKQCIVKGRMDVAGSGRNHRGQIHRGEVEAVALIPPEGLKVQPVCPQAESYQDEQEEKHSSGC